MTCRSTRVSTETSKVPEPISRLGGLSFLLGRYFAENATNASEQLEFPFGRETNDLPLDAICRVHEISVAEALGDPAPEPLRPAEFELQ